MKTRKGFVSNSSSASFIVGVDTSIDEFLDELYYEFNWSHFKVEEFQKELEKEIEFNEKYLEKFEKDLLTESEDSKFLTNSAITQNKLRNECLKRLVESLSKLSPRQLTTVILNHNRIMVCARKNGKCELSGWTVMYNSVADAPEFLHTIVFWLALTGRKHKVTVERD